jgi:hypothetical protein
MESSRPSTQIQVEAEEEVVVEAMEVAVLEIRFLDNNS